MSTNVKLDQIMAYANTQVSLTAGTGVVITGSYPNFTISMEQAQYFTFESNVQPAQNFAAGANTCTLLAIPLNQTLVSGTDWRIGPGGNTLEYIATKPKIYMMSAAIRQLSSNFNFRPAIYITNENVVLNGNGQQIFQAGISTGQITAINSVSGGVFITAQPGFVYYISVINSASPSVAGVSTNFQYDLTLAEAR